MVAAFSGAAPVFKVKGEQDKETISKNNQETLHQDEPKKRDPVDSLEARQLMKHFFLPASCIILKAVLTSCEAAIMIEHLGQPHWDPAHNNQQNLSSSALLVLQGDLTQVLLAGLPSAKREEEEACRHLSLIPRPPHLD